MVARVDRLLLYVPLTFAEISSAPTVPNHGPPHSIRAPSCFRSITFRDRWDGGGRSHRRAASRGGDIPAPSNRPGMVSADSASGSMYDGGSSSPVRITSHIRRNSNAPAHGNIIGNGNGQGNGSSNGPAPGHRRRGSRHSSMAQGEGSAIVAAAVSGGGGGWKEDEEKAGIAVAPPTPFKDTSDNMDDDERETLMSLLTGAYLQV